MPEFMRNFIATKLFMVRVLDERKGGVDVRHDLYTQGLQGVPSLRSISAQHIKQGGED